MLFCPLDGTLLQIITSTSDPTSSSSSSSSSRSGTRNTFACSTCPYSHAISPNNPHIQKSYPTNRKKVDDILGGANAWENVDKTAAVCPSCSHTEAYFLQMQIRSADEPMSVFYKCVKCSNQWNDK